MAKVQDPVCGMTIDSSAASEHASFRGTTYHFCSPDCHTRFDADPGRFADASATSSGSGEGGELERHEPPYTEAGGLVAPKFGSAGSGGLEYERLPEAHDDPGAR